MADDLAAAAPTSTPDKPQRSKSFYRKHGNVVIQVENTLYKLDRGSLCEFSPIFADMFTLPQGDLVTEGLTDENPIHLGDTTAREFDHLIMTCLHVVWSPPPHPIERHLDVLKLASRWEFPGDIIQGTVYELLKYNVLAFPPIQRLMLARMHNIPEFIPAAFTALCGRHHKLIKFSCSEIAEMGQRIFQILAQVKEAIKEERNLVAYHAPSIDRIGKAEDCNQHSACGRAWKKAWWDKIAREILQPSEIFSCTFPGGVQREVEKMNVPGMTGACRDRMVAFVMSGSGFDGPQAFIDAGIAEVQALLAQGEL